MFNIRSSGKFISLSSGKEFESEYVLCGNYYKIIDKNTFFLLKRRHFGFLYLPVRTYQSHEDAMAGIFKDCKLKVCAKCYEPMIRDQFGLYCPNEECDCMGMPTEVQRHWNGRILK